MFCIVYIIYIYAYRYYLLFFFCIAYHMILSLLS